MFKKVVIPILIVLAAFGVARLMIAMKREAEQVEVQVLPPLVRVHEALIQSHRFEVRSQGTVEPLRTVKLVSEVDGRVVEVSPALKVGGMFREGDVLVRLDARDFELAVTRARAEVESARTRLRVVQAEADVAQTEWADLGRSGVASDLLMRKPQLAEASAAVAGAEAALEKALLDLERTELKAPFDGVVRSENLTVSQFVRRGEEMASLFAVDRVEVKLPVPLYELEFLDLSNIGAPGSPDGPEVVLTASQSGWKGEWIGRVTRVDGEVDPRSRMTHLFVEVDDPYGWNRADSRPALKAGMFVAASVKGRKVSNVFAIPRVAVRGENTLLKVTSDNKLEFAEITSLRKQKDIVVVSAGVANGDRIIVSPMDAPVDGMEVRVLDEEGAEQ